MIIGIFYQLGYTNAIIPSLFTEPLNPYLRGCYFILQKAYGCYEASRQPVIRKDLEVPLKKIQLFAIEIDAWGILRLNPFGNMRF